MIISHNISILPINSFILRTIAPSAPKNIDVFVPYFNRYMEYYGVKERIESCMFLAQTAHESGGFRYVRELSNGKQYEGRKDLGNIMPGDGVKYKGHGLIQITGRHNHERCSYALFGDNRLLKTPELLEVPEYAVASACWFWFEFVKTKFNKWIKSLTEAESFERVTRVINGGLNGLDSRKKFFINAKRAIPAPSGAVRAWLSK